MKMFVSLFVSGYLAVKEMVKPSIKPFMAKHFKDLMADVEVYGCAPVKAYYAVWLQQIENGRVQWSDSDAKPEFRRVLVWYASQQEAQPKSATGGGTGRTST